MNVYIQMPNFDAIGDLSGAEIEVLSRIMAKLQIARQEYVGAGDYVYVPNGKTPQLDIIIKPAMKIQTQAEMDAFRETERIAAETLAATQKAARAAAVAAGGVGLIELLYTQSLMYYGEPERFTDVSITPEAITIFIPQPDGSIVQIIVDAAGTCTRGKLNN